MFQSIFKNPITKAVLGKINHLLVFFVVYFVYLLTLYPTVQTEDSGELITSALVLDVAHPPGYPLYVLVGKLFSTLLPFGNMAWRINTMSAFFGAGTAFLLYVIIKKMTKNEIIAFGGSLFYAFSNIVWEQSNRGEVYTLNTFCFGLIIYLLLRWHEDKKNKWLYLSALTFGLGVGDHHLLLLAAPAMGLYVMIKNWRTLVNPKIIAVGMLMLTLGLSVYAYLPIRTYVAPYDNPAFIEHSGLYTWDKFINFVNRKIYGGTVTITEPEATKEANEDHLPTWLINIKDFLGNYGERLIENNARGFLVLSKIISIDYFYLPVFLLLPGFYALFKKDWRWASFITLLFLCYTCLFLVFDPIDNNTSSFTIFSTRPFMMQAMFILGIIMAEAIAWLHDNTTNKKIAVIIAIMWFVPAAFALGKNLPTNNQSNNYLANDFNLLTLASVPRNGYLISIGRDNMTFPLYYLRKIENIRPDITLEIYYSSGEITKSYLQSRVEKNGGKPVYLDLLPPNYSSMGLKPYNFIYQYGEDQSTPPESLTTATVRGIKKHMDPSNTRVKMLFLIKKGIWEKSPAQKKIDFDTAMNDPACSSYYLNIIGDYAYSIHDFDTAKKAYEKSGNTYGLKRLTDQDNTTIEKYQSGMT